MQVYGEREGKIALGEETAEQIPFLTDAKEDDHVQQQQVVRGLQLNRLVWLAILIIVAPVYIFFVFHAPGPHWHGRPGPHGRHRPGPPQPPTPVQCHVINSATPSLNLSLDATLLDRPRSRRHKENDFFIHPSLSGVNALSILRTKPISPPPGPPPPRDHRHETKKKHNETDERPLPEPVLAEIHFEPGTDEGFIQQSEHHNLMVKQDEKKNSELFVCVMRAGPGSIGLAAFPVDPTKEDPEDFKHDQHHPPPPPKFRPDPPCGRKPPHGHPPHSPFSPEFSELLNRLTLTLHLPSDFPPAGLDISIHPGPPFGPYL
ncbi:unnamed protein product [Tilletia caries]|uniref:Uncharacterized protein n=1 Tax=Tilletia caries TaxID=13290 RepID=A0ABN7IMG0_9BASI|nr:unnamed protein product [Tilletia caries]CAD6901013.1 unnamed protein product [Tilletia controversa]CAD6907105.1 unnamed protein product [Tilletia caries]CAD6932930.1 unnamed protein product [Tilletia controversa]CAD6936089.1 unnamed protein product [Tilletia caries]